MKHFDIINLGGLSLEEKAEIAEAEAVRCHELGDMEGAEILYCEAEFIRQLIQQYEQCL
jgi:hypothetical protein